MSKEPSTYPEYQQEGQADRLARKSKEYPFMPIGLAGLAGALTYGIYSYRNRGEMSTSVYLMKFRVIAQGTVVAALTAGVTYTLLRDYVFEKKH